MRKQKKSLRLDYHNLFVIFLRASPPGIHSTIISAPTFAKTQMESRIVSGLQLRLYPTQAFYTTLRLIRSVVLIGSAIAKPPLMLLILLTNLLIITSEYQRKCKCFMLSKFPLESLTPTTVGASFASRATVAGLKAFPVRAGILYIIIGISTAAAISI